MSPEEALQLIDNALSQLQTNREGHVKIQQAVQVIMGLVPKEAKEKKEDKYA